MTPLSPLEKRKENLVLQEDICLFFLKEHFARRKTSTLQIKVPILFFIDAIGYSAPQRISWLDVVKKVETPL